MRLSQAARKFNLSTETIVQYLNKKKSPIDNSPNAKLTPAQLQLITQEFTSTPKRKNNPPSPTLQKTHTEKPTIQSIKPLPISPSVNEKNKETTLITTPKTGFRILGTITLPTKTPQNNFIQVTSSDQLKKTTPSFKEKKAEPTSKTTSKPPFKSNTTKKPQKNFKARRKYRKEKKNLIFQQQEKSQHQQVQQENILKITPRITTNELAGLLKKPLSDILDTCTQLGRPTSINQKLDKETILFLAEHYHYRVEFITLDRAEKKPDNDPKKLRPRAPIVTVMGHVDHGKTSLLDYIRKTTITQQEAGGITQHIGAYEVNTPQKKRIVFLDTPGHEAFTAMRARGAQLTDIAIIIIAADEKIMPQTKEAITHAQLANLPIIIAINKIDKPGADPDLIKAQLADIQITVEDLGGTYQCQEISAKTGEGIQKLLEKIDVEAELLALKADPTSPAQGTVIEATLERGKGYLANLMVHNGTLQKGNILRAGACFGKIKAIFNSQGKTIQKAPPATPVQVLGLNGAPYAGEPFETIASEKQAREIANQYKTLRQQQTQQAQKKEIKTIDDIINPLQGAKILNIIIKADVNGSIEALADSILPLSTPEVKINIIHQAVGPISESDVLLASTTDSYIIGYHTKINKKIKQLAQNHQVIIQLNNLIHEAIEATEKRIKGLTEPIKETIPHGYGKVIQIFRVKGVGTIAGCHVEKGSIKRNSQIRVLRDKQILYEGPIKSLKVETEDVKEARQGLNCGIHLRNFDNLKIDDQIEAFEVKEI